MEQIEYDEGKFRELFLYVCARLGGDPSNGSVKANKVLFFSDFFHYADTGKPITGVEYVHHRLGPAPKGVLQIQQALIDSGEADQVILMNGSRAQKMLFPKRKVDLDRFTADEISTVELVLDTLKDSTADEASEFSHAYLAWQLTTERETIPYHFVFMYEGPVPEETFGFADELIEEIRRDQSVGAS